MSYYSNLKDLQLIPITNLLISHHHHRDFLSRILRKLHYCQHLLVHQTPSESKLECPTLYKCIHLRTARLNLTKIFRFNNYGEETFQSFFILILILLWALIFKLAIFIIYRLTHFLRFWLLIIFVPKGIFLNNLFGSIDSLSKSFIQIVILEKEWIN